MYHSRRWDLPGPLKRNIDTKSNRHAEYDNLCEFCVKSTCIFATSSSSVLCVFRVPSRECRERISLPCWQAQYHDANVSVALCYAKNQRLKELDTLFAVIRARYPSLQVRLHNGEALNRALTAACATSAFGVQQHSVGDACNRQTRRKVSEMRKSWFNVKRVSQCDGHHVLLSNTLVIALIARHSEDPESLCSQRFHGWGWQSSDQDVTSRKSRWKLCPTVNAIAHSYPGRSTWDWLQTVRISTSLASGFEWRLTWSGCLESRWSTAPSRRVACESLGWSRVELARVDNSTGADDGLRLENSWLQEVSECSNITKGWHSVECYARVLPANVPNTKWSVMATRRLLHTGPDDARVDHELKRHKKCWNTCTAGIIFWFRYQTFNSWCQRAASWWRRGWQGIATCPYARGATSSQASVCNTVGWVGRVRHERQCTEICWSDGGGSWSCLDRDRRDLLERSQSQLSNKLMLRATMPKRRQRVSFQAHKDVTETTKEQALKEQLDFLDSMKVYEEVCADELVAGTHVLSGRWVDTMNTPLVRRSKYTVRGYEDTPNEPVVLQPQ